MAHLPALTRTGTCKGNNVSRLWYVSIVQAGDSGWTHISEVDEGIADAVNVRENFSSERQTSHTCSYSQSLPNGSTHGTSRQPGVNLPMRRYMKS
jgi:hypothetical protein